DRFLADILGNETPKSFAYPFSARTFKTKRQVSARFATARGNVRGVNAGSCDLADLRANSMHIHRVKEIGIQALIDKAVTSAGWLIFYTHDIGEAPTAWG